MINKQLRQTYPITRRRKVDMNIEPVLALYALPMAIVLIVYLGLRKRAERRSITKRQAAAEAGLLEPPTLHPEIDPTRCIGCGACLRACPEGEILGLINGKAMLVEPSECIGHGACRAACPSDAIRLVFGTAQRGVDIPHVGPDFQTNVPGVFVAGELGGMGLIRNAIEQGRQAIDSVRALDGLGQPDFHDVVIVGGGPAGFSASLAAMQHKLSFVTVEQDSFGGTVAHYPRGKLVMTAPADLPLIGAVRFREVSKERLLEFWHGAAQRTGLRINYGERVESVTRIGTGLEVVTTRGRYPTRSVLLAIGRRGTPRRLDVPGEDLPKVVYRLIDPQQYRGQRVLVVGGGDSALEAAASIAAEPGATVTLSHRSQGFSRAKLKNRERVEAARASGRLGVLMQSDIKRIGTTDVELAQCGKRTAIRNDAVIVCVGGILPTPFLKSIGVEVETKYGTA
jgi:thioredoxin reductase/NAD-dependent dihydropyrimidine dehydrogenase PreA subunit